MTDRLSPCSSNSLCAQSCFNLLHSTYMYMQSTLTVRTCWLDAPAAVQSWLLSVACTWLYMKASGFMFVNRKAQTHDHSFSLSPPAELAFWRLVNKLLAINKSQFYCYTLFIYVHSKVVWVWETCQLVWVFPHPTDVWYMYCQSGPLTCNRNLIQITLCVQSD